MSHKPLTEKQLQEAARMYALSGGTYGAAEKAIAHAAELAFENGKAATSTFARLRGANIARNAEWNVGSEPVSLAFRGNELAGETGELCNVLKKLERARIGIAGSRSTHAEAADELADVVICADLIAMDLGIDLGTAVSTKFNATSSKYGLSTLLGTATNATPSEAGARPLDCSGEPECCPQNEGYGCHCGTRNSDVSQTENPRGNATSGDALLHALRYVAQCATPGEWFYQENADAYTHIVRPANTPGKIIYQFSQDPSGAREADARYMATANPAAVLALIDRVERAEAAIKRSTPTDNADDLAKMTRMFNEACASLGLINEALGLDPNDGGAEPILYAINELKNNEPGKSNWRGNLEDLRTRIFNGHPVTRDAEGWYCHPALPTLDENIDIAEFLKPFGIEATWVSMQDDDSADMERYSNKPDEGCLYWTPRVPDGDGWTILSIHDHEDGPFALFARREVVEAKPAKVGGGEREAFEQWAKQQQPRPLDLTPFEDTYDSDFTSNAWDGWQARAALSADDGEAVDLEGLRAKLLDGRSVIRDEDGLYDHPAMPTADEDVNYDWLLAALGIETRFVSMEVDDPAAYDRYGDSHEPDCHYWTPTAPEGDGWQLLSVYGTEDGPYALFGRDIYAVEQARKKEHTRRIAEAIAANRARKGEAC